MYYDPIWINIVGGAIIAMLAVAPLAFVVEALYNLFTK